MGWTSADRSLIPGRCNRFLSSPKRPDRLLPNTYRGFYTRLKYLGREANHSPLSSFEVKNEWSYTSTPPYAFMALNFFMNGISILGTIKNAIAVCGQNTEFLNVNLAVREATTRY
jgi:hypothetical protein